MSYFDYWQLVEKVRIRRDLLSSAQDGLCAICGKPILDVTDPDLEARPSVDHVIPRQMGGADRLGNMLLTHRGCNTEKGCRRPTGCELVWLLAVNSRIGVQPMKW